MLKITNDGRKLALDQRLIDPTLGDNPHSKVNACIDNVIRIYEETKDKKSTQLIFCDMSTPQKTSKAFLEKLEQNKQVPYTNVYDDIYKNLLNMAFHPMRLLIFMMLQQIQKRKNSSQK